MKLDVLAFAAHPDDLEITCGGTLARLAEQGCKVGACDLTRGEMGTRGTPDIRAAEAEEARRALGLAIRINGGLPDTGVANERVQQARVVEILRTHAPDVVILPGHEQRHPDHRHAPRLVFDACYLAGLAKFGAGTPHRPRKIVYVHTHYEPAPPTFVIDISAQIEKKLKAVRAYASQFSPAAGGPPAPAGPDIFEWVRRQGSAYGLMIGTAYGEGFTQRETMEVEDLAKLKGRSI